MARAPQTAASRAPGEGFWDALALAVLFLLPLAKFARIALGRSVFASADHAWINLPLRAVSAEALKAGHIPLWNKALSCGTPHLGQTEPGVFYPGNLLLYSPLELLLAYDWTLLFHFGLFGAAFYILARLHGGRPRSAGILAGVLTLCPFVLFNLSTSNFFQTFWLVPASFIAWEWARRGAAWPAGGLAGLLLGLNLLSGRPELAVYIWSALGVVALAGLTGRAEPGIWKRILPFFGTALPLGIGIAAVQLRATFEFLPLSTRGGEVASGFGAYGAWITPWRLFSLVLFPTVPRDAGDYNFYHLSNPYLGAVPLVLILLAWPALWRDRGRARPLLCGAGTALLLALAPSLPLVRLILEIPPFSRLRYPGRAVPVLLCLAGVLAVLAWEKLEKSGVSRRLILPAGLIVAGLALLFVVQAGGYVSPLVPLGQFLIQLAPLVLLFVPALRRGWKNAWSSALVAAFVFQGAPLFLWYGNFGSPRAQVEQALGLLDPVASAPPGDRRVLVSVRPFLEGDSPGGPKGAGSAGWWRRYPSFLGNGGLLAGAEVVNEYNHFAWKDWYTFNLEALGETAAGDTAFPPGGVADLVGLKWLLVPDRPSLPGGEWRREAFDEASGFSLWRRTEGPGLVSLAGKVVRGPDPEPEKLAALAREGRVDFRNEVIIADPGAPDLPGGLKPAEGTIEHRPSGSNEFRFRVTSPHPAYLVLRDHFAPGWEASLNGARVPCWRANTLFKAVLIPAGSHEVDFRFRPPGFRTSLAVSSASVLLALFLLAAGGWRIRQSSLSSTN